MRCFPAFLLSLLAGVAGCRLNEPHVQRIGEPEYPRLARTDRVQGTVQVGVQIGVGGNVLWAKGSGASPILVEAAEKNARQWVFAPLLRNAQYPIYREIKFVYRLEGKPTSVIVNPPTVRTHLPDEIEIIATPYESDYRLEFSPVKPAPDVKR